MSRMEEYRAMLEELEGPVPELEGTLDRAKKRRRKAAAGAILRCGTGLAACFGVFVLLVNFCTPVAYACARIPVLRELAEAVTFSKSLTDAVDNAYVQPMGLSQTENEITARVEYLIVDQKQVNVFFRLESDRYPQLTAHPDVEYVEQKEENQGFSVVNHCYAEENGELLNSCIDFVNGNVPEKLRLDLNVFSNVIDTEKAPEEKVEDAMLSDETAEEPEYLAEFSFILEFDSEFTASGKKFPVNQTVELDGQAITVTDIEVYPTHMRVEIGEAAENTAWLKDLDFYIETDRGMRFEPVSNGISATGAENSLSMVSYRADSSYFYEAQSLKLVITGAKWLRKDLEKIYLNLVTGESGELPEGASFESAKRIGNDWIVKFRAQWTEGTPMHQLFGHKFYDKEGNAYEINRWSNMLGEEDENGRNTFFYDEFPLRNYPYEEVWLTPQYSHLWQPEKPVEIPVS